MIKPLFFSEDVIQLKPNPQDNSIQTTTNLSIMVLDTAQI